MKVFWKEFLKRGAMSAVGGPLVLAIIYGILGAKGVIDQLSVQEVCLGICSSALLAFVAAGSGSVYKLEQLPVLSAALIQGGLLYADYLLIYLLNGWLPSHRGPILLFSIIFVLGYSLIWLIIYLCIRSRTKKLNALLPGKGSQT